MHRSHPPGQPDIGSFNITAGVLAYIFLLNWIFTGHECICAVSYMLCIYKKLEVDIMVYIQVLIQE